MAFTLYCGHSLEKLSEIFSDNVYNRSLSSDTSPEDLLKSDIAVVQTRGTSEYLRQVLAARNKISANLETPFLNNYINRLFRRFYGAGFAAAEKRSDPQNMRCSIMKLLSEERFVKNRVPELIKYIYGVNAELKRWQLAGKIADLFDQYQIYRSEKVNADFFAGEAGKWQKAIYQEIFDEKQQLYGRDHFFRKFLQEGLTAEQAALADSEVSIFGVGALPPVYLNIFTKLAGYCQVNFFYLTVCLEYWEKDNKRKSDKWTGWQPEQSENPILNALGNQGRGFFAALMENQTTENLLDFGEYTAPDDYAENSTMLDIMHYDILHMFNRRSDCADNEFVGTPRPDLKNDHSVVIHNCHSIRRELEVLHDELLNLIQRGTPPEKILVMAPDIDQCAPIINAVFGSGPLALVYSIADLLPSDLSAADEVVGRILQTAAGRFEYSQIIALLDLPMISAALKLEAGQVNMFADLLQQAGARWGFDGKMCEKFCGRNIDEYSWQTAFERLLAGFACRSVGDDIDCAIDDVSPLEALEGDEIETFSRIIGMIRQLARLSELVILGHEILQWNNIFESIFENFFAADNLTRRALAPLRSALKKLCDAAQEGLLPGKYPLNAVLAMLDDYKGNAAEHGNFLRGKITFCRMIPMRSIPMDVIALLNLNEGDFPRRQNSVGFDLIAGCPLPGDRSLAQQDRYLMLEAIMAAQKNLLLFYCGQSAKNNEETPACAPLNEVAGYLYDAFGLKEIKHRISGINKFYYEEKPAIYTSFDRDNFQALQMLLAHCGGLQKTELQRPDEYAAMDIDGDVSLDSLVKFFSNPASWILAGQFGLKNSNKWQEECDVEMWTLSTLDFWRVDPLLIDIQLKDLDVSAAAAAARRRNILPPGDLGMRQFQNHAAGLGKLPSVWCDWLRYAERRPLVCAVGRSTLNGSVNMSRDGQKVLTYSWSSYKSKTAAAAVLGTLMAAVALDRPVSGEIINISSGKYEFRQIKEITPSAALEKLQQLLDYAAQVRSYPPMLFPRSSVFFQASKSTILNKYCSRYSTSDIDDEAVKYFYSAEDWSDEFCEKLQSEGAAIYDLITEVRYDDTGT